jgi:general secretion pathway protein E
MHTGLSLDAVCIILEKRKVISSTARRLILEKQKEQAEKIRKLHELKGDLTGFGATPAEIISSLNLAGPHAHAGPFLDEETVMRELADELGVPFKKIDPLELDIDVVTRTVSKAFAIRHLVVPVAIENGELQVAMVDPCNRQVLDDLRKVQKLEVRPVLSTKSDIAKLIQEFFGFKQSVVRAERELVAPFTDVGNLEQYSRLGTVGELESTDKYIQNAVDYLFRYAFEQRASDIHLEPKRDKSIVRFRIDGVLYTIYSVPVVVHNAMISRLKSLSRLNIAEKRRPQDGRVKLQHEERDIEIRVSMIPVAFGEKAVLRVLNSEVLFQNLENLGFDATELIRYRSFLEQTYGIILFTGPTGSGKTTSLYSSLKFLSSSEKNITSIEDPIEMVCEEYNQIAVQPAIGITFASILRNVLRQDPDVIMVGEIRDQETARNAIQAALTGHLVLSTLHTNDAASAVTRLVDLGVEPFLISSTLLGVVAQRLVRTVCPHCQEIYAVSRQEFLSLGLDLPEENTDAQISLKRGRGCLQCRSTGYIGREAVFEVLGISDAIKKLINERCPSDAIKRCGQKEGMKLLRESALHKILKGRTSYSEVLRCISQQN